MYNVYTNVKPRLKVSTLGGCFYQPYYWFYNFCILPNNLTVPLGYRLCIKQ